jgi:hypothetical protein
VAVYPSSLEAEWHAESLPQAAIAVAMLLQVVAVECEAGEHVELATPSW